ncbi:30S ribosomal protein S8 [Candidatus Paracaedibacter symbiosus]|uniref:30S ribosomal protein S8 n=1 Tax=Candidatus Paracaedibacter symbiosus TaxID=244582 RepID=UPI0005096E95|nr:30S ribosomal protein S8 [Candidatus Paracaedibacter symbiosus]
MYVNDPIGDMLTRIRNGQLAHKAKVVSPNSKQRRAILDILKSEGYIRGYSVNAVRPGIEDVVIELRYVEGEAAIKTIDRVSKLGRRVYSSVSDIGTVHSGLGIYILSTSKGVMSDVDAKEQGLGGEILCKVF